MLLRVGEKKEKVLSSVSREFETREEAIEFWNKIMRLVSEV